jgi:hypothetical protein
MPVCKNHKDKTYKGSESSPLGRGYSAYGDDNGKVRVGKDGTKYVAKTKIWKKYTNRGAHRIFVAERIAMDIRKSSTNKK